ncbi:MAG: UDP-glucose/GDP-mannose dehydrogenase family protein [Verrucomicrobia bacterium]|nr:UDP-glucose/GDP-mannose dehydrogenase family protein [Verrucomicrobiota bacterium]MDA1086811.1 UDP-glucose/GDP-mannose dehydrogenase family protein [Verrucomicrobiota bacterium]
MHITVIGTGYVGLVSGTCLSETGNDVLCIDIDERKVQKLQSGQLPIYEPDLDVVFERNRTQGRLTFSTDLAKGVEKAEVILLALPTPPDEDGSADLRHILAVARQLGPMLKRYVVVATKSTVPVGTADKVRAAIQENCQVEVDVVSNPEFLREGFAVSDFMKPDRVVVGTESARARKIIEHLYNPFVRQGNPIIFMDERSAEMTKYAANAFLATKISFMNEIANLCERLGANVDNVRRGIGTDNRIGKRFLFPGIGYGGSCFPKDVQALAKMAEGVDCDLRILSAVRQTNAAQKKVMVPKVVNYFGGDISGKRLAMWGLSFKPDTDDTREAPSLEIISELLELGATVTVFDPEAMPNAHETLGDRVDYAENCYDALKEADALIIVTEWAVFRNPDFVRVAAMMRNKVIFDGRNLYEIALLREQGFHYESIGRPCSPAAE